MHLDSQSDPVRAANAAGFYTALVLAVLTAVTFGIAVLTPPLSGPFCLENCFQYPYLDIASRFPRDYYWMYPAMLLTLVYLAFLVVLHVRAPADRKVFSHFGLALGVCATVALVGDYFVQVSVIQPSLVRGETDGIPMLTQFNDHGLFIALEELGYLAMSLSFLAMAPALSGASRLERAVRWVFVGGFVLTVVSLVAISAVYGIERSYRFEVAVISIDWLVLIASGILMSLAFRKATRGGPGVRAAAA